MDINYTKKLIDEIEKSGFPLELDVFERLRKLECTVYPNISYVDRKNAIREIDDIVVLSAETTQEWPYGCIHLDLIVECKTTKKHPWIFFPDPDPYPSHLVMGLSSNLKYYTDIDERLGLLEGHMNTDLRNHHYNNDLPVTRTYCEAFGKDAGGSIYKAIHSIWNAMDFNMNNLKEKVEEEHKKRSIFMQGVIILKGDIFIAHKVEDTFDIQSSLHVLLRTIDCSTDRRSPLAPWRETIIDVIREDYLEEYIKLCKNDLSHFVSHLKYWQNAFNY